MAGGFFAEARWLDRKRLVVYPRVILAIYIVIIVGLLVMSPHLIDPFGKPVGTDFINFWAAGRLALQGAPGAAYDYARHFEVEYQTLPWPPGQAVPYFAWCYPPMFLLPAALFALLPFGLSLLSWIVVTLPMYLAVIRRIMPGRDAMIAALAFPAVLLNLGHGQNGFLTAGLLGGGVLLLDRRPFLAGILLGLLAYKPQFGLVLPLALLIGCHWRAILGAAASVIGVAALSWILLGSGAWQGFIASLPLTRTFVLEQGASGWPTLQSSFAAVRELGGGIELAYLVQAVVAIVAMLAVLWIWRRPVDRRLQGAALATATLLATPYVLDYDLIVLALPIAWLAAIGMQRGFLPWEKTGLLAAWLLPLFSRVIGLKLAVPIAPFVMLFLLALIVRRARTAVAAAGEGVVLAKG